MTEVVNKNPHIFKQNVLDEISMTMIEAGRNTPKPIFVAGFGNRPTDAIAYEHVGIGQDMIFLLDTESRIRVFEDMTRSFESYDDPQALIWLLVRLKNRMESTFSDRIDQYIAREVVLADDKEEMRIAMQKANVLR